jgi:hypothetical protein
MEITVTQEQGHAAVAVISVAGQLDGQTYQDLIAKRVRSLRQAQRIFY